jgi:N-methylhydantoinase A
MSVEEAAEGIVAVVNSNMTRLLWEVMIGRGYDPRDFTLLAFGGAGPLHACELAQALGIREVAIPPEPGTFSAYGILGADIRYDRERMLVGLGDVDVDATYGELERDGRKQLEAEHAGFDRIDFIRSAELRYAGQDHLLAVEVPQNGGGDLVGKARELFQEKHERLYGFRRNDMPVDLVRIQVSVVGRMPAGAAFGAPANGSTRRAATRPVYAGGGWVDAEIHDRAALTQGVRVEGPAVIEERGSTTYVPPGFAAEVDPRGLLRISVPKDEGSED